jgi:hypothetical protein
VEKFRKNGLCQLICPDCEKKHAGQTGRSFKKRYKDHVLFLKNNKNNISLNVYSKMVIHLEKPMISWKFCNLIKRGLRMDTKGGYASLQTLLALLSESSGSEP